jgi:hypothetical protein
MTTYKTASILPFFHEKHICFVQVYHTHGFVIFENSQKHQNRRLSKNKIPAQHSWGPTLWDVEEKKILYGKVSSKLLHLKLYIQYRFPFLFYTQMDKSIAKKAKYVTIFFGRGGGPTLGKNHKPSRLTTKLNHRKYLVTPSNFQV